MRSCVPAAVRLRLALCLLACAASTGARTTRADAVSGDWSGAVEAHVNYFEERSTSALIPDVVLELASPQGVTFSAEYLLDVISSASIAQTSADGGVFTERRHQAGATVGYGFGSQMPATFTGGFIYSHESDYDSRTYLLDGSLSLWQRTTTVSLAAAYSDDTVLSNRDPAFRGERHALTLNAGVEQVLTPRLTMAIGYSLSRLDGFLANPYRRVLVGPLPVPETHPDQRLRHAAFARLAWFIVATDTAVHLSQRVFSDSWGVHALSPAAEVVQSLSRSLLVSAAYRYYLQGAASFFMASYPPGHAGYITNDPKLAPMTTQTLGGRLDLRLDLLDGALPPLLGQAWAIVTFDRYWSTSAFGNGYMATAGLRVPF